MKIEDHSTSRELTATIRQLEGEADLIPAERQAQLRVLSESIRELGKDCDAPGLIFVCTHNSRRSQLAEAWFRTAVYHYRLAGPEAYSAGTEATAFYPAMVAALRRCGFQLLEAGPVANPEFSLQFGDDEPENRPLFSKVISHAINPVSDFIAVMVCSDADAGCPVVQGASGRFSLPYTDPKVADGTAEETTTYDQKVREIGREILYLARCLKALD